MCGIVGIFNLKEQSQELRQKALKMSQKIRHRGPDWSGIYCGGSAILAHERLLLTILASHIAKGTGGREVADGIAWRVLEDVVSSTTLPLWVR